MTPEETPTLTRSDVCKIFDITPRTLNRWMRRKRIEYVRFGRPRFTPAAVEKMVKKMTVKAVI